MKARRTGRSSGPSFCSSYNPAYASTNRRGDWRATNSRAWKNADVPHSWWQSDESQVSEWHERKKLTCTCTKPEQWRDFPEEKFIDTHCHLEALDTCESLPPSTGQEGFDGWWERSAADSVGCVNHLLSFQPPAVAALISSCCDPGDLAWYEGLAAGWDSGEFRDERFYFSVGIHPYCARDFERRLEVDPKLEQRMLDLMAHPRCIAIGECGLDYCKTPETHEAQKRVFVQICRVAVRLRKPLVVHARDSPNDAIAILRENIPFDWPIHLHGFTGDVSDAEAFLKAFSNLYIGLCGAVTMAEFYGSCGQCAPVFTGCRHCGNEPSWVKRNFEALIPTIPLDRMLLETDAPYLTPAQWTYKPCQPWMLFATAEKIAQGQGITIAEVINAANRNARRIYDGLKAVV